MTKHPQTFRSRMWFLIFLLPVATVAGTILLYQQGPPIFQLYILYSLELLTHPLIALFLILTLCTLSAVMILRYRHRSELLAFAFLFSAVLHLLTVAFFSLWVVEQPMVEMSDSELRHEITTGLPSFSETMVGEDLRSLLQEIAVQEDARELEARAETEQASDVPLEHERAAVVLPERDLPLPSRQRIQVDDVAIEQPVDEQLKALPVPTPARDATKLVHVEPIETSPEPSPKPLEHVDQAALEIEQAEIPFRPEEQSVETPTPALPDVDRPDYERDAVELAKATVASLRVEERLEERAMEQTVDQLTMPLEQEQVLPEETHAVEPTERNVSDAAPYNQRAEVSEDRPETQTPELTSKHDTLASAVETNPELPAFTRHRREVAEDSSQVPATAADSMVLELADVRSLLPAESDAPTTEPMQPNPRELTTDRIAETRSEATPLAEAPPVDAPTVVYVPQPAAVEMTAAQYRDAPRVSESLTAGAAFSLSQAPASAIRDTMDSLAVVREAERVATTPSPARDLHAERTARPATAALPVSETPMAWQQVPDRPLAQVTSLADTRQVQTAAPATALPTVSEQPSSRMTPGVPATITVAVGGRLMLVEASPRTTALRPAPLSRRDIVTAYRRVNTDSLADVPLPETSRLAAPRDALSRVSQQSIMVSDSIRSMNPHGQAPEIDATLTQVMPAAQNSAVNVTPAVSAIALSTTGSVARTRTVADVHTFAGSRVAMSAPADDVPPAMPGRTEGHVVSPTPAQTPPSAWRTATEARVGLQRQVPRAGAEVDAAPATALSPVRVDVAVAGHIKQTAGQGADRRGTPAAETRKTAREIRVSRLQTAADYAESHKMTGLVNPPERTVSLPPVEVAATAWETSVPTMTERRASVEASTASEVARLRVQPVQRVTMPMSKVAQPRGVVEPSRAVPEGRRGDQALDLARMAVDRSEASLPEHGVPPPRTTFVVSAPTGMTAGSRLPVGVTGVLAAPQPVATVHPSERLTSTALAASSSPALPVLELFAQPGSAAQATAFTRTTAARAAPEGARQFSLSRRDSHRSSDAVAVGREPGRTIPRPELSERAHDRTHVALNRVSDARASVSDDVSSSAADRLRSLIAAEVSASRELPSRRAIYQLRSPDKRKEHIETLGGSSRTESAVEEALDWLAASQSRNGRWDVDDFEGADVCGGRGNQADADVGITGFTLLAFLGAGYTHIGGKHQATVKKAIEWIMEGIGPDGDLRRGGQMYDQAMATTALCEAISLTGDTHLKPVAERAVQFILDAQNPGAAWRYHPRDDNDTSVTGWQILALKSAELAGIPVPPQHYRWTELWLDEVRSGEEGGLYLYRAGHAVTPVMTAEGWFCQLFMGEQSKTRGQEESNAYVMQHLPVWSREIPGAINFYYWYYATLALHLSGSESFDVWNDALTTALLQGRITEGPAAGTWDPASHIGIRGGRIYSTAVATLCLEVYYRFLPFYKLK